MARIRYPKALKPGDRIAVTAPSSGVEPHLHVLLHQAKRNVQAKGFEVVEGETIWTENKASSASKEIRAKEFMNFLEDESIRAIIPPWGGQFLMEILPLIDWERMKSFTPTWVMGYSDISTFLFCSTLQTGIATAHGPNYCEMSAEKWDPVTEKWLDVLGTAEGGTVIQTSSDRYQSSWEKVYANPGTGFYFDRETKWNVAGKISGDKLVVSGRLIGGCLQTLVNLTGTPYAPVEAFAKQYAPEGLLWYLESTESHAGYIYRFLWNLKESGWFRHTNGVVLGRMDRYRPIKDFEWLDAVEAVFGEMDIPVITDADVGHQPPQMTWVNGAWARVTVEAGRGTLEMRYI